MIEYPDCIGVKLRAFAGSCCTPPHNAKMVCNVEEAPQEKVVLINDDEEVVPQPSETAVQPNLLNNSTVLKDQLSKKPKNTVAAGVKIDDSSIKDRKPTGHKITVNDPPIKVKHNTVGGGGFGG